MLKIKKDIWQYLLIYLCLVNTNSKLSKMFQDPILILTCLICLFFIFMNRVHLKKKYCNMLFLFFGVLLIQHVLIQRDFTILGIGNTLCKFLIAYCAVGINAEKYISRYVKVISFLSIVSIIMYLFSQTPVVNIFKYILISNYDSCWTGDISYGRFFYHYIPNYDRNVGIFNEPGVYQIFLNVSLYFLLFKKEECNFNNIKRKRAVILTLITIITTASTAGYVTTLLLIFSYILLFDEKNMSKKIILVSAMLIGVVIFIKTPLFEKVFIEKMAYSEGKFDSGTGNARLASMEIDLKYIKENPFGRGTESEWVNTSALATQEVGSSVGLTSIIATYGIPISIIIYGMYMWAFYKISNSLANFGVLLLIFISSFLTQPWVLTPVFLNFMALAVFKQR